HVTGVQTCALPIYRRQGNVLELRPLHTVGEQLVVRLPEAQPEEILLLLVVQDRGLGPLPAGREAGGQRGDALDPQAVLGGRVLDPVDAGLPVPAADGEDRKSTRLNSSHVKISYAVFCLKKKK